MGMIIVCTSLLDMQGLQGQAQCGGQLGCGKWWWWWSGEGSILEESRVSGGTSPMCCLVNSQLCSLRLGVGFRARYICFRSLGLFVLLVVLLCRPSWLPSGMPTTSKAAADAAALAVDTSSSHSCNSRQHRQHCCRQQPAGSACGALGWAPAAAAVVAVVGVECLFSGGSLRQQQQWLHPAACAADRRVLLLTGWSCCVAASKIRLWADSSSYL